MSLIDVAEPPRQNMRGRMMLIVTSQVQPLKGPARIVLVPADVRKAQLERCRRPRFLTSHLKSGKEFGEEPHSGGDATQLPPYNGSSTLCRYRHQLSTSDSFLVTLCGEKTIACVFYSMSRTRHWTQANFKMFPNF